MRIPRSIKTAGMMLAAVLLGLMAVQGSYALWAEAATGTPGTVQSAAFTVNLSSTPSGRTVPMTIDGQPATLALTTTDAPLQDLARGGSVYTSLAIANASDAGGDFDISITATEASLVNLDGGALAGYLGISATRAASPAACTTAIGYQNLSSGFTTSVIAKGGSTVMCFKVTLDAAAPASIEGNSVAITIPLQARQECGVPHGCA